MTPTQARAILTSREARAIAQDCFEEYDTTDTLLSRLADLLDQAPQDTDARAELETAWAATGYKAVADETLVDVVTTMREDLQCAGETNATLREMLDEAKREAGARVRTAARALLAALPKCHCGASAEYYGIRGDECCAEHTYVSGAAIPTAAPAADLRAALNPPFERTEEEEDDDDAFRARILASRMVDDSAEVAAVVAAALTWCDPSRGMSDGITLARVVDALRAKRAGGR